MQQHHSYIPTPQDAAKLTGNIMNSISQIPNVVSQFSQSAARSLSEEPIRSAGQTIQQTVQNIVDQQPQNVNIDIPPQQSQDINQVANISVNLPENITDITQLTPEQQQAVFATIMSRNSVASNV